MCFSSEYSLDEATPEQQAQTNIPLEVLSAAAGAVPVAGELKSLAELYTGRGIVTGAEVSPTSAMTNIGLGLLPGVGAVGKVGGRVLGDAATSPTMLKKLSTGAKAAFRHTGLSMKEWAKSMSKKNNPDSLKARSGFATRLIRPLNRPIDNSIKNAKAKFNEMKWNADSGI